MSRRKLLRRPGVCCWRAGGARSARSGGAPPAIRSRSSSTAVPASSSARKMTPEREAAYRAGLAAALDAGYAVLEQGGSSLDAVIAAVRTMEDDPQFNAGRGAVLNQDGVAELDAAIMDGNGPRAGAVAGGAPRQEPDRAGAAGDGEEPARAAGRRGRRGIRARAGRGAGAARATSSCRSACAGAGGGEARASRGAPRAPPVKGTGTVGAVALDRAGNLAAGTSTGGLTNKLRGRVGRFAHHRRGNLRQQRVLRGVRHRPGRVLHPPGRGLRHLRAWSITSTRRWRKRCTRRSTRSSANRRRGRRDRHGPRRQHRHGLQQPRHVPRRARLAPAAARSACTATCSERMYAIAIHGGAGAMPRATLSAEREQRYRAGLEAALDGGYAVLVRGGSEPGCGGRRGAHPRGRPVVQRRPRRGAHP